MEVRLQGTVSYIVMEKLRSQRWVDRMLPICRCYDKSWADTTARNMLCTMAGVSAIVEVAERLAEELEAEKEEKERESSYRRGEYEREASKPESSPGLPPAKRGGAKTGKSGGGKKAGAKPK
jgi:hypothetical protein